MVRRWVWGFVLLLWLCDVSHAQKIPFAEVFGGYSYTGADPFSTGNRVGLNGWDATFTITAGKRLGLVADFGGDYGTSQIPVLDPTPFPPCPPFCPTQVTTFPVKTRLYTFLFGAQLPYRKWDKFTPYVEVLFGRARLSGKVAEFAVTDGKFAYTLGAGADYTMTRKLAWRVQADYLHTNFLKSKEDNFRLSTGIVFRLVGKEKKPRTLTTP